MLVFTGNGSIGVRQNPDAFKVDQTHNQLSTENKNHYSFRSYGSSQALMTQVQPSVDGPGGNNVSNTYRFLGHSGHTTRAGVAESVRLSNTSQNSYYVSDSYNPGGYWNSQSGFYTVPETGLYLINYGCASADSSSKYFTMFAAANAESGVPAISPLTNYKSYKYIGYPFHWESDSSEACLNYSGAAYLNKYDILGFYTLYDGGTSYTRTASVYFSITFVGG